MVDPNEATATVEIAEREYLSEEGGLTATIKFVYGNLNEYTDYGYRNDDRDVDWTWYVGQIYGKVGGIDTYINFDGQDSHSVTTITEEGFPPGSQEVTYIWDITSRSLNGVNTYSDVESIPSPTPPSPPSSDYIYYPRFSHTYVDVLNGVIGLLQSQSPNYWNPTGGVDLTANQLALLDMAKVANWDEVEPLYPIIEDTLNGDYDGTWITGLVTRGYNESFPFNGQSMEGVNSYLVNIKLLYDTELGANVSSATVTTTIPTDNYTETIEDIQVFTSDELRTTDFIDIGVWPEQGLPTNEELVVEITWRLFPDRPSLFSKEDEEEEPFFTPEPYWKVSAKNRFEFPTQLRSEYLVDKEYFRKIVRNMNHDRFQFHAFMNKEFTFDSEGQQNIPNELKIGRQATSSIDGFEDKRTMNLIYNDVQVNGSLMTAPVGSASLNNVKQSGGLMEDQQSMLCFKRICEPMILNTQITMYDREGTVVNEVFHRHQVNYKPNENQFYDKDEILGLIT